MTIFDWLPALTTTMLFAGALWLAREVILYRLTRSVQHEFDKKMEQIRVDFRAGEEALKARIREREGEIAALRSGALSAMASRQTAADKRRLEAIDQLWAAFNSLGAARILSISMAVVNFKHSAEAAQHGPKVRKFFELMGAGFDQSKIDTASSDKARPFVSPMAWAVFSAYRAVVMHSVMQWLVVKGGLGTTEFADRVVIEKLIVAALPHFKPHIELHGPTVYHQALQGLETRLLEEFELMLIGTEYDKATITQAATIMTLSNDLQTAALNAKTDAEFPKTTPVT